MGKYTVSFQKRDFSGTLAMGDYQWKVERLAWRAVGGPWSGRLRATAGYGGTALPRLWALTDLLRCGVKITANAPAWWGYVSAVEIHAPKKEGGRAVIARLEIDSMWNRAMGEYYTFHPAKFEGERNLTAIYERADSIANYGYKERVYKIPGLMTASQAAVYVWSRVVKNGYPSITLDLEDSATAGGYYAELELRGWWESLDWRFYTDARGRVGNTTGGTVVDLGSGAGNTMWAESFACGPEAWTVSDVWVKMRKEGAPADNVQVDLMSNSGSAPGASLASATVTGYRIGRESDWYKFTFASPYTLTASTTYWVRLSRSGAASATNYYQLMTDAETGWAGGRCMYYTSVAWAYASPEGDLVFQVIGTMSAEEQITRVLDATNGCGQFLAGSRIEPSIAVPSVPYRDGSTRGREELELHLATGTSTGARLLARIDPERVCRVYAQPASTGAVMIVDGAGKISRRDTGLLDLSENPAGEWVELGNLATAGMVPGFDKAVFVESCTWTEKEGFRLGE